VEVTRVRPVRVRWRLMSLSVLNEGRDDDPEGDPEGWLRVPVRVCAAVLREHGERALGRFYAALWDPALRDGDWIADFERALAAAGLPAHAAAAGSSTAYDEEIRASHAEGIGLVGEHVGTPVTAVTEDGVRRAAFFGPVLSRVPRGEEAGRLWDGTLLVAGVRGFHELKGRPHAVPDLDG
jgi:hypothetical protein